MKRDAYRKDICNLQYALRYTLMDEQKQAQMAASRMVVPAGPRPPAAPPGASALTPKDILVMLRRHILLIVSLTILGLMLGGVTWYFLLKYFPRYTAQTYIRVLSPVEKDPMVIGIGMTNKDIQYGHRLSMVNLIKQQSTLQRLLGRGKIQETKWFKHFGKGRAGESRAISITKAFKDLEKYFRVYAQRDAEFISVSMTCGDKREAALIVNEMVDLFLLLQGRTKKDEIAAKLAGLKTQRDNIQNELDYAERAMAEVRRASGFTDLEQRYFEHTITLTLNSLELEQNDLALEIKQLQASIGTLEKLAVGFVNEQVQDQIENDPTVVMLTQQLVLQEARLAGALTRLGENHRDVRQMQESISDTRLRRDDRRAEIAEQTRQANFKNAQDGLIILRSRFEESERLRQEAAARKRDLDLARVQYEQRVTIRDERKDRLKEIKMQIGKRTIMHDDPETPKVQKVGDAPVPLEVSSPKWEFYFPGGTVLGFMCAVGLTFLIELLNDLVRTPRDVGKFLHIPLLGVIPDADEDEQTRNIDLCHVVRQAPYSIISESYRRLRANFKLSRFAESSKVLLVSSGMAGDGKTSVAANFAATFVAENKRVLLVDANFWRPSLHKIFPKSQPQPPNDQTEASEQSEFGLSTLLAGLCGYQEVIRPGGIEGLSIIDSGLLPSNPAELLGGPQMEQLLKHQRQSYDYVIVDGPPILLVSEAKVLARLVDGTILVFNAGATRRGAAMRTIRELREVNATIIGCVLLAVKAMKGGYFHEQFKSYQQYQELQLARSV